MIHKCSISISFGTKAHSTLSTKCVNTIQLSFEMLTFANQHSIQGRVQGDWDINNFARHVSDQMVPLDKTQRVMKFVRVHPLGIMNIQNELCSRKGQIWVTQFEYAWSFMNATSRDDESCKIHPLGISSICKKVSFSPNQSFANLTDHSIFRSTVCRFYCMSLRFKSLSEGKSSRNHSNHNIKKLQGWKLQLRLICTIHLRRNRLFYLKISFISGVFH